MENTKVETFKKSINMNECIVAQFFDSLCSFTIASGALVAD